MPAPGVALPGVIVYAALAVIVLLGILAGVLYLRLIVMDSERYEAVAERNQARAAMRSMQEMSRTHADTIARIAAFKTKKYKNGGR